MEAIQKSQHSPSITKTNSIHSLIDHTKLIIQSKQALPSALRSEVEAVGQQHPEEGLQDQDTRSLGEEDSQVLDSEEPIQEGIGVRSMGDTGSRNQAPAPWSWEDTASMSHLVHFLPELLAWED